MPEAKKLERYKSLVGLYSALRNYPKVIDFGNRALKISRDPEIQVAVAQAYYQSGNNKEAVARHERAAASSKRRARFRRNSSCCWSSAACSKANDNACVAKVFEKLVSNYPKPEYWSKLHDVAAPSATPMTSRN